MKECNVLGGGPSRISYIPNDLPTIGCNFPWTKVDYTVINDVDVITKLIEFPELLSEEIGIIFHQKAYNYLLKSNIILTNRTKSIFTFYRINNELISRNTGHYAALWMIREGFTKLNIYGCDNFFGDLVAEESFTDTLIRNSESKYYISRITKTIDERIERGRRWKLNWDIMIEQNPNVEFNFVR